MTDDDIDTGPIISSEVAPAPSEYPRVVHVPDEKSREEHVKGLLDAGLTLAAHGTEDASDYFRERETQEKFLEGQDLSPAQMREWHERAHSSLQRAVDAQARARGEVPPSQQQASVAQELPNYVAPDAPDYDENFEAAKERFSNYFDVPERIGQKEVITEWLTTHDPKGELVGYYMGSPLGPQMAEAIAAEPQVIPYLLSLPRQQQAREMAKLEGYLHAQQMLGQQNYAPPEPQPRRVSQAPPPIAAPRGGANPPKNLFDLATRSDVKDYIDQRRKQEYQAAQERELESWRR